MVDEQNILTRESEPKKCIVVSIGEMTIRMKGYYFLDNKISVLKPCLEECFESVLEQFCSFFSLIEYCVVLSKTDNGSQDLSSTCAGLYVCHRRVKLLFQECLGGKRFAPSHVGSVFYYGIFWFCLDFAVKC